jgi:hypothetical protein
MGIVAVCPVIRAWRLPTTPVAKADSVVQI